MTKNKNNRRWLKEHFKDSYVKQAQGAGLRSRAAFKLMEIQKQDRLFKPGMTVVDLGAAPGSWSQFVYEMVKPSGHVIAVDILPMKPLNGVTFIQGDFTDVMVVQSLLAQLPEKADWVLSDMAPNLSGHESIDIPMSLHLAELALDFALVALKEEGGFLVKIFQGEGIDAFYTKLKHSFKQVLIRKPKASRGRSREIYILSRKLKTGELKSKV